MRPVDTLRAIHLRHLRARQAERSLRCRAGRLGLGLFALALFWMAAGTVATSSAYASLIRQLPSLDTLPGLLDPQQGAYLQPTRLVDRTGQKLIATLAEEGVPRRFLPLDPSQPEHFSPDLARVTVAALDPDFTRHPGFSLGGLFEPAPQTIAEQLVSSLIQGNEESGFRRTLRLRTLAAQVTARYGRQQVLEWYLNSTWYGRLAYGADTAALAYLGKPASQLNLAEAALLVSVSQAPASNPLDAPRAARENQVQLLTRLQAKGAISQEEFDGARATPLVFRQPPTEAPQPGQAFARLAVEQLTEALGREQVERGGLLVTTTLDESLQLQVECTLATFLGRAAGVLPTNSEVPIPDGSPCEPARQLPTLPMPEAGPLSASAVLLDPQNGQVLALVGDTSLETAGSSLRSHPPGTVLSPFIYLSGFSQGMGPATLVWDIPATLPSGTELPPPGKGYRGPLRMRSALASGLLAPAARLLNQLGPQSIWEQARTFGLPVDRYVGSAQAEDFPFSGGQVSPLELAQAFGVFANQGVLAGQRPAPVTPARTRSAAPLPSMSSQDLQSTFILLVKDSGGHVLLDWSHAHNRAVLSQPLAYLINSVLSDEPARWEALGRPSLLELGRPAAALLGTNLDGNNTWTAGYTPQRVGMVWVGRTTSKDSSFDPLPASLSAGLWRAIFQFSTQDLPPQGWSAPPGITTQDVCDPSGLLATEACPQQVREEFLAGSEPDSFDPLYRRVQINRQTGRLATAFTPPVLVEEKVLLVVPEDALDWARSAGLEQPPEEYDPIQVPAPNPEVHFTAPDMFAVVRDEVDLRGTVSIADLDYFRVELGVGINPQEWILLGEDHRQPVQDVILAKLDTRDLSGLYTLRLVTVRSDQRAEFALLQVTVDNIPPTVEIISPGSESVDSTDGVCTFQAQASDEVGLARLDWTLDGSPLAESTQPALYQYWKPTPGPHTVQVTAFDQAGNSTQSAEVHFTVE